MHWRWHWLDLATVIDVLRRTGRLAEAVSLLPRAMSSINAAAAPGAHTGGRAACLTNEIFT